ncbi:hypothetical protein WJ72_24025 [Burkholderia ubonensis]|nr:hypothetical protein WJ72_24025 [Burkholderia ubonensis]
MFELRANISLCAVHQDACCQFAEEIWRSAKHLYSGIIRRQTFAFQGATEIDEFLCDFNFRSAQNAFNTGFQRSDSLTFIYILSIAGTRVELSEVCDDLISMLKA